MVQKTITELGPKEAEFLSSVSTDGGQFTIERAVQFLGIKGDGKKETASA